ncbi:hydroxyacylglutathione hydrolase [Thiomicrorhabdus sp.]|uniref:hydroxyacylglutathione hydrolase n=1 Tax=Thiomicrorhabdus sp. TaxID=2039724 RepID=UPI0029C6DF3C|nr:hydroxyacylglutathione hydrolase [Thiomicrorhabdus sp.]
MQIHGIPALVGTYDNYIWILSEGRDAWVVDPGQAPQVIKFLDEHQLQLRSILVTHRHFDHVDGIPELKAAFPGAVVYGPEKTPVAAIEKRLVEGDQVELTADYHLHVLDTPGHTEDHISFYNQQDLFCGDTIFTGGCGRLLGGTLEEFADSLLKLRDLPDHLNLYCGHEYTTDNLNFACLVEPKNPQLQQRVSSTKIDYPCILNRPQSTLGTEKATNPFLRFDLESIAEQLKTLGADNTPAQLFAALRSWKDRYDQSH